MNLATGKTGSWESRDSGRRTSNGKVEREVLLSSLPKELQLKWTERQRADVAELDAVSDEAKFSEEANPEDSLDQLTKLLSAYPADERAAWIAEALRLNDLVNRYEAINPKRKRVDAGQAKTDVASLYQREEGGSNPLPRSKTRSEIEDLKSQYDFVPAVKALCKEAVCTNEVILAALSNRSRRGPSPKQRTKQISPHTFDAWARRRKQSGLLAFIRSKSNAKKANDGRLAEMTPAAAEWLEARWGNHPIATLLYEKWEAAARKHGWKIPALSYLQRRWKAIPPAVRAAKFLGDKVYTDKYKPFLPRTAEDLEALQILCGDHHVLDVFCWSDKLKAAVRLWLTVWQDLRTGLIWGWHLDYTPSSFTIGCAYANGVRTFGAQPPSREGYQSYIYTDNGKDYRCRNVKGEIEVHQNAAAVEGGLRLLMTQRGVGLVNDADTAQMLARKFNGREKPVERTFRDLADFIQNEFFNSGWCGRNTNAKPDSYRELYARHVKAMKRGGRSPFPLENEVRVQVVEWIDRFNTSQHTRTMLGGATVVPLQEYNRLYKNRFEIREETLALMVMKTTRGPLRKNGVVALGSSYWHAEISKWKGRKVDGKPLQLEVRYLDSDYTVAWIVLPDGGICEAQRVDVSSVLTVNRESLKASAERDRSERSTIKNYQLLQQSIWRGESVEDRMVAELPQEQPEEVRMPIAVGENPHGQQSRVMLMGRFDAKKHRAPVTRMVTAADISNVEADESIFGDEDNGPGRVVEFDFEEND